MSQPQENTGSQTPEKAIEIPLTNKDVQEFNKKFIQDFLATATSFSDPLDRKQLSLLKLGLGSRNDVNNYYILVEKETKSPITFKVEGLILTLNVSAQLAPKNRPTGNDVRLDRYLARVELSPEVYEKSRNAMTNISQLWTDHPSALSEIAQASRMRENEAEFLQNPIPLTTYGFTKSGEIFLTKMVASLSPLDRNSPLQPYVPLVGDPHTEKLKVPSKFSLRNYPPVFDKSGNLLVVNHMDQFEHFPVSVFFQVSQAAWGNKITIQPEPGIHSGDFSPRIPCEKSEKINASVSFGFCHIQLFSWNRIWNF